MLKGLFQAYPVLSLLLTGPLERHVKVLSRLPGTKSLRLTGPTERHVEGTMSRLPGTKSLRLTGPLEGMSNGLFHANSLTKALHSCDIYMYVCCGSAVLCNLTFTFNE